MTIEPMTCQCGGCVKCYDVRGDCQRVVTEDDDWCGSCAGEYERVLRAVMAEAMSEQS